MKKCNLAVVGATGAVGESLLSILAERKFPVENIYALASERSAGTSVMFGNKPITVENLADFDFSKVEIGLFSAGGSISEEFAPKAADAGCVVVDNTSCFRYEDDIPLVVTEVNPQCLADYRNRNIHRQSELLDHADGCGPEADSRRGGNPQNQCGHLPGGFRRGTRGGGGAGAADRGAA